MKAKNINTYFFSFLLIHLFLWTVIPSFTNSNLPLDTIEALAWGSDLKWGFNKHPPFSAFASEFFYQIFGNQDWAFYFLSQIFVVLSFFYIFKFSSDFFQNSNLAFFSVLLLEGIFFYNFTTPEFNVNISQLPFWAISLFFTWRCIKDDKLSDYIILSFAISLGILSKYLFFYLVIGIKSLFFYLLIKKKQLKSKKFLIVGPLVILIISPHLIWLYENEYVTLVYGLQRTGGVGSFTDHLIFPITLIAKQIILLLPFFILLAFLLKKFTIKLTKSDKLTFLIFTSLIPLGLIIFTSFLLGAKIRTMWMTPFYLTFGVLLIEIYKKNINFKNLRKFYFIFVLIFLISPLMYLVVSLSNEFKRTDYPGKEIARLVQNKWNENFINDIKIVVGDEWSAGNLSYHLESRPKWKLELNNQISGLKSNEGVIYTGNPKILKQICPGVFGTIKPVGYCMIGKR